MLKDHILDLNIVSVKDELNSPLAHFETVPRGSSPLLLLRLFAVRRHDLAEVLLRQHVAGERLLQSNHFLQRLPNATDSTKLDE